MDFVNEVINWKWRNRQSKFIRNEVYCAWYNGWDLELPFWDVRILELFRKLPYELLYDRKFQRSYTCNYIDANLNNTQGAIIAEKIPDNIIKKMLKKFLPRDLWEIR